MSSIQSALALAAGPVKRRSAMAALAASAVLAACAAPGDLPERHALRGGRTADAVAPWPSATWWTAHGDTTLNRLVEQALQDQPGLQAVQVRLQQAQALVDVQRAAAGPQASASADLTDQHFTRNGLIPPPLAGSRAWNNSIQLGASWELDLFGRQRAALDAAIGLQRALQADLQAARVLLAGQVAATYVQLARLVDLRELAERMREQRIQWLVLAQQRQMAGLETAAEVRSLEGQLAQAGAETEALAESATRLRHAIAELTGQPPQALQDLAPRLARMQPIAVPDRLPLDLLGRRADLVAQRWRVEAAAREEDLARAQFHPNVNLAGFVGLSSLGLGRLLEAGALQHGVGPALRLPVFDGGRLRANLQSRHAEVDAAIESYNAALLRALREVADELASLQSLDRQQQAQAKALTAAQATLALARQRLEAGLGTRLAVLSAQIAVLAQQRAETELQARVLVGGVALSRALGGGYTVESDGLPTDRGPSADRSASR